MDNEQRTMAKEEAREKVIRSLLQTEIVSYDDLKIVASLLFDAGYAAASEELEATKAELERVKAWVNTLRLAYGPVGVSLLASDGSALLLYGNDQLTISKKTPLEAITAYLDATEGK